MNIHLIDHVIVCEGRYYSFADEGPLQTNLFFIFAVRI